MSTATQVAQEVAKHMPGWVARGNDAESPYVAAIVRSTDGATIKVYVDTAGKRADLRTDWPRYADGASYHPPEYLKASVSTKRSGEAIAGEIERRLLPQYLPMYAKALDEVRDGDLRAKAADDCRKRLAKLTGGDVRGDTVYTHLHDVDTLRVMANKTPSVQIRLYGIDELTAIRILTILKQRQEAIDSEPSEDAPEGAASATAGSGKEVV